MTFFKRVIFGKYIDEIEQLQLKLISRKDEIEELNKKVSKLSHVVDKIEESYPPEHMIGIEELRCNLAMVDKPYYQFVVAAKPLSFSVGLTDKDLACNTKTIKLETMVAVTHVDCPEERSQWSHQLAYNLARSCGDYVTDKLLKQDGWRV